MNEIARRAGKVFFWAGSQGEEGWFMADFGEVSWLVSWLVFWLPDGVL